MPRRLIAVAVIISLLGHARAEELGLKLPPGFKVTLWADHELANDIYAMTLDDRGDVIVTSRGWVKRLDDTKYAGKADRATTLVETPTGGMGLYMSQGDLYFSGDGWFSRYGFSVNGGVLKAPTDRYVPLRFTEHGGHAMRKGPDGCWYVIYGNTSDIEKVKMGPTSPIAKPEAGGILRFSKDMKQVECIADGFRNPYDFDFTPLGDIITYDSDTERDFLLPWYTPTRMYHVAYAAHHGWRLPGYLESLARRDYYPDVVDMLWPVGRGSPTGVVCYRHVQFPKHYHGGVFALDWTFGKIWFFPLEADGSSYKTKAEVFLEPAGINGFAPTDACVAPDGSMFVSIGGRGTRGAIFHIEYVGTDKEPAGKYDDPKNYIERILNRPQPLDAWSRAKWEPAASIVWSRDREQFLSALQDPTRPNSQVIRGIEIINDLFGPLPYQTAASLSRSREWPLRARVAWSLGRDLPRNGVPLLIKLAQDEHPRVRVEALNSLGDVLRRRHDLLNAVDDPYAIADFQSDLVPLIVADLNHADKRVRMAASHLITQLDVKTWFTLQEVVQSADLPTRLNFAISHHWPGSTATAFPSNSMKIALEALESSDKSLHLPALRLLMLLGDDWCIHNPPAPVYGAYALQKSRRQPYLIEKKVLAQLRKLYPSADAQFNQEAGRYFAMVEDDDPETAAKVLGRISKTTPATEDVHHLIILSRLKSARTPEQVAAVVDALLGLETKLQGQQLRVKQTYGPRLGEVVSNLILRNSGLPEAMLKHPGFVHPSHLSFALAFGPDDRKKAARLFLEAVKKDGDFLWSADLVDLLGYLPAEECRPIFRKQWSDYSLRDAMLKYFAASPEATDRGRLLDGLDSSDRNTVFACIDALRKLPADKTPANFLMPLRRLRLAFHEPREEALRAKLLALVNHLGGTKFAVEETEVDPLSLQQDFKQVFAWFEASYPDQAKLLRGDDEDGDFWKKRLTAAPWDKGNAERGQKLFRERSCMTCHTGSSRIGPDLVGAAGRFSLGDLFTAIINPSRDVAPAFRVNDIETQDGKTLSGIVIFESADGIIVQTGATTTVRIDAGNLASRRPSTKSLMPAGLLKDLKPEDLADLYAYLKSLK